MAVIRVTYAHRHYCELTGRDPVTLDHEIRDGFYCPIVPRCADVTTPAAFGTELTAVHTEHVDLGTYAKRVH